jgi:hypothetical protein
MIVFTLDPRQALLISTGKKQLETEGIELVWVVRTSRRSFNAAKEVLV